jgi:hypothetical protein
MMGCSFYYHNLKEWGRIRQLKSPALRHKTFKFLNPKKPVLLWKMSSRLSQLHHIRFLYLNFIMVWLILYVKDTQCWWKTGVKWPLKIYFWIWMGQVSIFLKQEIGHTEVTLSFKYFSRMETWPTHIEKSMFNSHFTPIFHRNCDWAIYNAHY